MGHELLQAAQDCQSANSGINDANRLLFIHDVSSSAIAQKRPERAGRRDSGLTYGRMAG